MCHIQTSNPKRRRSRPAPSRGVWVSCFRSEEPLSRSLQEYSLRISLARIDGMSSPKPKTGERSKHSTADLETNRLGRKGCQGLKHRDERKLRPNTSKSVACFGDHTHLASGGWCHCMTSAAPIKFRHFISFLCSSISGFQRRDTKVLFKDAGAPLLMTSQALVTGISSGLTQGP